MGIYPQERWYVRRDDGHVIATHTTKEPGLETVETFVLVEVVTRRDDCFCCSCVDDGPSDPYCRNHGFAGRRACEIHHTPEEIDHSGDYEPPGPLETVQAYRDHRKGYGR